MKSAFLQMAGVNTEKEFYDMYPTEEAFFSAHPEAIQMKKGGEMIRRKDGSYSQRGLWDNIRANKGSGKKPTKEMLEQERKIRREEMKHGGAVDLNAFFNQPRFIQTNIYEEGGDIHIDPSKKGTFKAQATRMGMGVQEAASHILANKEDYSPEMVKKAVFAHNFAKEYGGNIEFANGGEPDGQMALTQINAMMDRLENLRKFVTPDTDLDPWISDKLSVMNHSATAINDYMQYGEQGEQNQGEMMEMKNGGGIPERYKKMGFTHVGQKKEGDGKHKWKVLAKKGDQYKVVQGGYRGMEDFKQHHSEERRDRFWDRMGGRDSAKANDPFSPLYWHKRFGTWAEGGELPEMQWAGEFEYKNQFYKPLPEATNPSMVMLPDQQKIFAQNLKSWGPNPPIRVKDVEHGNTNFSGSTYPGSGDYLYYGDVNTSPVEMFTGAFPTNVPKFEKATIPADVNMSNPGSLTGNFPVNAPEFKQSYYADVNMTPPGKLKPDFPTGTPLYYADVNTNNQGSLTGAFPTNGQPLDLSNAGKKPTPSNIPADSSSNTQVKTETTNTQTQNDNQAQNQNQGAVNYQNPVTTYWQPTAEHQVFGDKTYRKLSNNAMLPLYNPAIGMMSDDGLSGFLKMGIGALAGISGLGTGLDNVWRGFQGRKAPVKQWTDTSGKPIQKQETIQQEMYRKEQNPMNPAIPSTRPLVPVPGMDNMTEANRTAAYGGMIKAENGIDYSKNPAFDPTQVHIGPTEGMVDMQGGLNRALGANMGINMFNNALGYKQGMKAVHSNAIKSGMTDFAYQPDDTNWMPMGYDTLNTGPGQTQAPNLYTPIQYAGMQLTSQYEEGGEYDLSEEEIQQILAAGGEIEFM